MNTPVPPSADSLTERLRDSARCERRVHLRALLPVIDALVRQGVPHQALSQALTDAGLELSLSALRKALYRWRKRTTASTTGAPSSVSAAATPSAPGAPGRPPAQRLAPHLPTSPAGGSITSKADLVRLRNSQPPIDLNHLAEIGRKK